MPLIHCTGRILDVKMWRKALRDAFAVHGRKHSRCKVVMQGIDDVDDDFRWLWDDDDAEVSLIGQLPSLQHASSKDALDTVPVTT